MPVRQEPLVKPGEEPDGPFAYHLVAGSTRILEDQRWDVERPGMTGWILNLTVEGVGRIGKAQRVEPGSLLLFAPKAAHDYGRAPESPCWHHRWIYFLPRSSWQDWLHWPRFADDIGHMVLRDERLYRRIDRLMQDVERAAADRRPLAETLAMNLLEQLLILLTRERSQSVANDRDPRVVAACAVIAERHHDDLGVADVAAAVGLSASRLAHLFREQMGVGVVQWRDQQRMQRACQLLKATGLPVREVAARVGYDDPLYFARVFRRHLNCSPSVYRARSD